MLLLFPALVCLATVPGCGGGDKPPKKKGGGDGSGDGSGDGGGETKLTELDSKGWGSLVGQVTFEGELPEKPADFTPKMNERAEDKHVCNSPEAQKDGDTKDPSWKIDGWKAGGGVADVAVFLKTPEGKYFKLPMEDKEKWKQPVSIDQPHCAYHPFVLTLFPSYYDGKEQSSTGQKLKVLNSAPVLHNTAWKGSAKLNPGDSKGIPKKESGKEPNFVEVSLKPDPKEVVTISCDVHKWMRAYAWALDHPYAAVTDAKGNFKIDKVPAGVEVAVVAWHPGASSKWAEGGPEGTKVALKEGVNTLNFKVKK